MSASTRDIDLNQRIPWNNEDLFRRKEILRLLGATEDLKKDRDGGRNVGNSVNIEEGRVRLHIPSERGVKFLTREFLLGQC